MDYDPLLYRAEVVVESYEQLRFYADGLEEPCRHPAVPTDRAMNQQESFHVPCLVGP